MNINITELQTGNFTYTPIDPCAQAFGGYANAYNYGMETALAQINYFLYMIFAGIMIIMWLPMFKHKFKTENQQALYNIIYSGGLFTAFACTLMCIGLQFVTISAKMGFAP